MRASGVRSEGSPRAVLALADVGSGGVHFVGPPKVAATAGPVGPDSGVRSDQAVFAEPAGSARLHLSSHGLRVDAREPYEYVDVV